MNSDPKPRIPPIRGIRIPKPPRPVDILTKERQSERLVVVRKHAQKMESAFRKAYSGKSKAAALKAKCMDCSGYQRVEITECTVYACPLYPYRPFQKG